MAAHRYWRIKCTSGQPDYYIPELDLRESAGGTRLTGTPVWNTHRSAPSTEFDGTKAFDGAYNSFWQGSAVDSWVGLDLGAGSEKFVGWYGVMLGQYPSVLPPSFTLDYSDNGTTWTVADTQVAVAWGSGASTDVKSFLVTAPVVVPNSHAYWRLTGFLTDTNALELSQAQLYDGVQLIAQAPTFSVAPTTGAAFPDTLHWDDFSMPGFALTWNLATPVASPNLRLGAGSGALNFPKEFYCQYSDDGKFWSTNNAPVNVAFPGAGLLTAEPGTFGVAADPDFSKVTLLLQESSTDVSSNNQIPVLLGADPLTSALKKYGVKSLYFDGTNGLRFTNPVGFGFSNEDFTVESWVYQTNRSGNGGLFGGNYYQTIVGNHVVGVPTNNGFNLLLMDGKPLLSLYLPDGSRDYSLTASTPIPLNTWTYIAFVRRGTVLTGWVNGVQVVTGSFTGATQATTRDTCVGMDASNAAKLSGYIDDLRITKGLARYTAAFTPPTASFPTSSDGRAFIPLSETPRGRHWRLAVPGQERIAGAELPAFNLREVTMETSFLDAYHGGNGRLYGTVKEKKAPLDIPLRREVLLIDEASDLVIRKTWSDPVTGDYEFLGVKTGVKYTVLSYDHLNTYRAVIADAQVPELMP